MSHATTMAAGSGKQAEGVQAARYVVNDDRSYFLRTVTKIGIDYGMVIEGQNAYNVIVWGTEQGPHDRITGTLSFTVGNGSFSLYEHMSPEQARLLARALNMAADHSEDLAAEVAMAERDRQIERDLQIELEGGAA